MAAARSRSRADETTPKPRSDAYVGLLGLSFLALSVALLFAYLNYDKLSGKPPKVQMAPVGGARPAPMTSPDVAPAPAAPQPGAMPPGGAPKPGVPAPPPPPAGKGPPQKN